MTPSAVALLGFAAWQIVLVVLLGVFRTSLVTAGKRSSNFNPSGEDFEGFGRRLTRAHANCHENIGVAAAILLYAITTDQTAVTDGLAFAFLGARIAQSLTHLASTGRTAILVRFSFFLVQIVIFVIWLLRLTHLI